MVKALFDTNILIDHLNGVTAAAEEIARYPDPAISVVTWIEVMSGADETTSVATRAFLGRFEVVDVDLAVGERAVAVRRARRVRVPDAIIEATARHHGRLLVTRDVKDFDANDPTIRTPYRL